MGDIVLVAGGMLALAVAARVMLRPTYERKCHVCGKPWPKGAWDCADPTCTGALR